VTLCGVQTPLAVSVLCERTAEAQFQAHARSQDEGAGVAEINLAQLPAVELTSLRAASWAELPSYVVCRRREFMRVYGSDPAQLDALTDDQRVERQFDQLAWAAGVDIELDIFQQGGSSDLPCLPAGVVGDRDSARRRRELVDAAHRRGKHAVLSCHTGCAPSSDVTLTLAAYMRDSGADACKIIHTHTSPSYVSELVDTVRRLQCLPVPFVLLSIGPGCLLLRHIACQAGCSYCFGRASGLRHFYGGHPPLTTLRELLRLLPPQTFWADSLAAVKQ
jgi:hypothetical protein